MMKKNYFTLLFVLCFVLVTNAQTTIFSSAFDEASYDVADTATDLNNHPDWLAGHFNNANTWTANGGGDLIRTGANFAYSLLSSAPITAAEGDVITITSVLRIGNDDQPFNTDAAFGSAGGDVNMLVTALSPTNTPINTNLGAQRDGVMFKSLQGGTIELVSSGGGVSFATNPSLTTANKSNYQIIFEYTIGSDAASTTKSARIRNLSNDDTSIIATSTGIQAEIYTALTGSGAYYFNWALGFYQKGNSTINGIYNNSLNITKNGAVLNTQRFNNFDFSMSPNPVSNILTIKSQETINKVEIFSLLGKRVLTSNNRTVDVSSLSKSVYLVRLTSDKGISIKKLIKN